MWRSELGCFFTKFKVGEPIRSCPVAFLLLIRYVKLWPLRLTLWTWTFVGYRLSRDQTLPNFNEIEQSAAEVLRFWYVEFGGNVYISLFNSYVNFHAKICRHCWNINKSRKNLPFGTHHVFNQNSWWPVCDILQHKPVVVNLMTNS